MSLFSGPGKVAFGFGLGIVAAGVVKEVLPAFRGLGKPLLRATLKSGVILARRSREQVAELSEMLSDVRAEVQAEMEMEEAMGRPAYTDRPSAFAAKSG